MSAAGSDGANAMGALLNGLLAIGILGGAFALTQWYAGAMYRKCSRCGDPGLHLKKRPAIRTVAGHSFKASVPAQVCDSCGAVYFNGTALGDFDLAVANKLARAGVSDGEAIKFMRKAVGLPAVTLAELLDTSPETVSRWERGVSHIDRAASPSWRGSS